MEKLRPWALCGLVISPILLSSHLHHSFSSDRPVHSAAIVFASIALLLILISKRLQRIHNGQSLAQKYTSLPLDEINTNGHSSRPATPESPVMRQTPDIRRLRAAFVALTLALYLRVDLVRRFLRDIQCAGPGYEVLLPLIFAAIDTFATKPRQSNLSGTEDDDEDDDDDDIYSVPVQLWLKSRYRYIVPVAILSLNCFVLVRASAGPGSTYICPTTTNERRAAAWIQLFTLPVDVAVMCCVKYLFEAHSSSQRSSLVRPVGAVGWAFLLSSFIMLVSGIVWYLAVPDDRHWMFTAPPGFTWHIVKLVFLSCITAFSALLAISFYGTTTVTTIVVFVLATSGSFWTSWHTLHPFPPTPDGWAYVAFMFAMLALSIFLMTQASSGEHHHYSRALLARGGEWFIGLVVILALARSVIWFGHTNHASFHPIDMLIFEGKIRHERYAAQASSSHDLETALEQYQARYNRHPPPGFDQWYTFATERQSAIMDDFDQINEDLLPFWSLSPAEIRQRTWEVISNPWNDVAGVSIRNGKAEISPNVMPTHRWMLDGIITMLEPFVQWLPDMDLGFNVNDECRVAVPYDAIEARRKVGRRGSNIFASADNKFSDGRADTWQAVPEASTEKTPFREMSFQHTFFEYGSVACPPDSPARSQRNWDMSQLCLTCTSPHSLGAFLSNWTLSADICYQPDMANLHGLYLSPAAFKAADDLYPIFSQSKAHGYNDILYPSAWNYMDKVKYDPNTEHPDPSFDQKKKSLFWRGATSEGVSPGSGTWRGMSRQRFVHLANDINGTSSPQTVLLPHPFAPRDKLAYATVSTRDLAKYISADVHIVDTIVRCGGPDCATQVQEFSPLVTPSDFQSHWSHRFLLDLDGAGFSGRFLPFLHSGSLPFKAALFREWYDARLQAWYHFVPLDLRGHGFWATLLYFAGLEGKIAGRQVSVASHDREGQLIAEKGREWAGRVLRKQDMEVYMFRLLLEWGRLTDEKRDAVGFYVEGVGTGNVSAVVFEGFGEG